MGSLVELVVFAPFPTLRGVTGSLIGVLGVKKDVMVVVAVNSIQKCAPVQNIYSVLISIASGKFTRESAGDLANLLLGKCKDCIAVVNQVVAMANPKEVVIPDPWVVAGPKEVDMVDLRVADHREVVTANHKVVADPR